VIEAELTEPWVSQGARTFSPAVALAEVAASSAFAFIADILSCTYSLRCSIQKLVRGISLQLVGADI
jgi:hypothetical protein